MKRSLALNEMKRFFENFIIANTLIATYFVLGRFLVWYLNIQITMPKEFINLPKDRYLIIANHRKRIDPWIILFTLPPRTFCKLLSIRFFTSNKYFNFPWLRPFLWINGCFRSHEINNKISGLKGGLMLSDQGYSLFIFPEGKMVFENEKVKPKTGIAKLAKSRNFTILPVYISYGKKFKNEIKVKWGNPFKSDKLEKHKDIDCLTEILFDKVRHLN
jgi:1-acyl-sn-glycerol-3-phosphate acyltransferase